MAYLVGDILAVSRMDLLLIWLGAITVIILMIWRWSPLLLVTLNEDMASASGFSPKKENMVLTIALATVVAVGIKIVGILLIVAMLIIPAASARWIVSTPEGMGIGAGIVGISSAILGIKSAFIFDTPTGPSIVCVASIFFLLSLIVGLVSKRTKNF
jgi:zinc transport system permease protein